jgi:lipoprotein-anchoring transpeptidase ErfK/SrfK
MKMSQVSVERFSRLSCKAFLVLLAASGLLTAAAVDANAQFSFFDYPSRPVARRAPVESIYPRAPAPRKVKRIEALASARPESPVRETVSKTKSLSTTPVVAPSLPLFAVVSIEDQHVSVYGDNGLIERSDISSGTSENPTPTGVFAVIQKNRWHESNLYSGAPMPFMQRLTWSGVAMHEGKLPGYPASHGCIRLPGEFAERWFGMTKLGLHVVIAPHDVEPTAFEHATLPVPRQWLVPVTVAARLPIRSAALSSDMLAAYAVPTITRHNPVTYAAAERQRAKAELKIADEAASVAWDASATAETALKDSAAALRTAERDATVARERLVRRLAVASKSGASKTDDDEFTAVRTASDAANARLSAARAAEGLARMAAAESLATAEAADASIATLKARALEMTRRQEPVSVLISRKDGRLYVRQALRPVFDTPVTFRDPEQPVGTHVYIASAPVDGSAALRWTAVSMPVEKPPAIRAGRIKVHAPQLEPGSIGVAIQAETAATALDRVQLPGEVLDYLSELVWSGATIIVSDHGITHETGVGTDFIIQTRH